MKKLRNLLISFTLGVITSQVISHWEIKERILMEEQWRDKCDSLQDQLSSAIDVTEKAIAQSEKWRHLVEGHRL